MLVNAPSHHAMRCGLMAKRSRLARLIGQLSTRIATQGADGFHEVKLDVAPGQQLSNVSVRFTNDAYEGKAETDQQHVHRCDRSQRQAIEAEGPNAQYHREATRSRVKKDVLVRYTQLQHQRCTSPNRRSYRRERSGATVGRVTLADSNTQVTVSDDRFEVRDGLLKLKDGVSLNFEDASNLELTLTGTNGSDSWTREVHIALENTTKPTLPSRITSRFRKMPL